jgi:hypothetical protein
LARTGSSTSEITAWKNQQEYGHIFDSLPLWAQPHDTSIGRKSYTVTFKDNMIVVNLSKRAFYYKGVLAVPEGSG